MATAQHEMAPEAMMQQIRVLAARKTHPLHNSMLGGQPLTLASAEKVLFTLERCPDRQTGATSHAAGRGERPSPARASGPSFRDLGAQIPAGKYAIPTAPGSENDHSFWQVDKGKPGTKWEGWTFLRHIVGGHDPEPVRDNRMAYGVLAKIVEIGIDQASRDYGRLIRACGFCDIPLTKRDSRYNGRGAKCSENHGLPYETAPADWEDPGEAE